MSLLTKTIENIAIYTGLPQAYAELIFLFFSGFFLFFSLVILILYITRGRKIKNIAKNAKSFEKDRSALEARLKKYEDEKTRAVREAQEITARFRELSETGNEREQALKENLEKVQNEILKLHAMEEEIRSYRIKLGEIKKEKDEAEAKIVLEKKKFFEEKMEFERECAERIEELKKKIEKNEEEHKKREQELKKSMEKVKEEAKKAVDEYSKEKEILISNQLSENEQLKKEIEKLKDKIRMLEIEKI